MSKSKLADRKKTYHHGDLRTALLQAGLTILEKTRAVDQLSLREIARAVGVSATAVYRHFPDKSALLEALAAEGLSRLAKAQNRAAKVAGGGFPGFSATGATYVRFALANPALFKLIFVYSPSASPPAGGYQDEATALLRVNAVALAKKTGGDAEVIALRAWALAHGLAMLMLDGQVPPDPSLIKRVVESGSQ